VKELSAPFDMSGPAVSKHLRILERARLIACGRDAQWRPRTLNAEPIKDVAEWAAEFRQFWDAAYARLDTYLAQLSSKETSDDQPGENRRDVLHDADRSRSRHRPRRRRGAKRRV
jgi:DNA-binding transcriptional ArsR family regulator